MDQKEIQDWRDFCESINPCSPNRFSSMFMELYNEPLTESDRDDLRTIFSYVPNSAGTLEKMLCLDGPAEDKTDDEIIALVSQDLKDKRRIIHSARLLSAIDSGVIEVVRDEDRFQRVCDGEINRQFFHELADYFAKEISHHDRRIRALSNAFYGIASNVHLQWALTIDLLGVDVNFDNYFELYLIGVDYALGEKGVLVMNYRAKAGSA